MKNYSRVLALALAVATFGQAHAATSGVRVLSDVAYLAPERAEKLDVYLPAARAAGTLSPAVVWIHGGGWSGGTKDANTQKTVCTTLANAGYVAVSINYRIGDGAWPQNLMDCKNAIRFLRAKAKEYQIDPERIAVGGGSAGAHLALLAGFTAARNELEPSGADMPYPGVSGAVRCVLDLYGPVNLLKREALDAQGRPLGRRRPPANSMMAFGTTDIDADVFRVASPMTYVGRNSPPVLILQGTVDDQVDPGQPRMLADALRAHGVAHEVMFVEGAGHGFDLQTWNSKPLAVDLRPTVLTFLAKHLGPVSAPQKP